MNVVCGSCEHRRGAVCAVDALAVEGKAACLIGLWGGPVVAPLPLTPDPSPRPCSFYGARARGDDINARGHVGHEVPSVAVVIVSHNYGRYLADAVRSVLGQTRPAAEIVVVDDSSDDSTRDVAAVFADAGGVRYVRVDARDVNAAREVGFLAVRSEVVCFLDADDMLSPDYLEAGLKLFADPLVSLVYSDWEYFGARSGRERFPELTEHSGRVRCESLDAPFPLTPGPSPQSTGARGEEVNGRGLQSPASSRQPTNIAWRNFAHAASLVRRSALVATDAFNGLPDMTACRHHCDWAMWRRVLTGTRRAAKQTSTLLYRQHDSNWLQVAMRDRGTYYDRAALSIEPVTIYVPLSGRVGAANDVLAWLDRQTRGREWCRVVLLDASRDPQFNRRVRQWAARSDYPDVRVITRAVSEPGTAGGDATQAEPRRRIVEAMWRIYDGLPALETEYILTVEDDVIPPDDAIDRLLRGMDHDVCSVASPYRGRYGGWMAADVPPGAEWRLLTTPKTGLRATTFNGFGCTLLRRSVLRQWAIGPYAGTPDFDMALYLRLRDQGHWRALIDWDCRSIHAGLLPV